MKVTFAAVDDDIEHGGDGVNVDVTVGVYVLLGSGFFVEVDVGYTMAGGTVEIGASNSVAVGNIVNVGTDVCVRVCVKTWVTVGDDASTVTVANLVWVSFIEAIAVSMTAASDGIGVCSDVFSANKS